MLPNIIRKGELIQKVPIYKSHGVIKYIMFHSCTPPRGDFACSRFTVITCPMQGYITYLLPISYFTRAYCTDPHD